MVVGTSMQLSATLLDENENPLDRPVEWISGDASVFTVDANGEVRAVGLGIAFVAGRTTEPYTESGILLQALPKRVEIAGPAGPFVQGGSYAFTARMYDANDALIPNVELEWGITGPNGQRTNVAWVDRVGNVTATSWGRVTVGARYEYDNCSPRFTCASAATTEIAIQPRPDYQLAPILSSGTRFRSNRLRVGFDGQISANDAGEVVFLGSLDGVAGGVIHYQEGNLRILASGAAPTPVAGGVVSGFSQPVVTSAGATLVATRGSGEGGGLLFGDAAGLDYRVLEGQSVGRYEELGGFANSRPVANALGQVFFSAGYQRGDPPTSNPQDIYRDGFFRFSNGELRALWDDTRTTPEGEYIGYFLEYGADDAGNVFLFSDWGSDRVLFRIEGTGAPRRMLGVGDVLEGLRVNGLWDLKVAGDGGIAFGFWTDNGPARLARRNAAGTWTIREAGNLQQVYSASASGVVYRADLGDGMALRRWSGDDSSVLLRFGEVAADTGTVEGISSAVITPSGRVFARLRTSLFAFVLAELTNGVQILVKDGDPASLETNVFLQGDSLVRGSQPGKIHLLLGEPKSLFSIDASGLQAVGVVGDRIAAAGDVYSGPEWLVEADDGSVYFSQDSGEIFRIRDGETTSFVPDQGELPNGESFGPHSTFAVNAGGHIAFTGWHQTESNRIFLRGAGADVRSIATSADNPDFLTQTADGRTIRNWWEFAIDSQQRVMARMFTVEGPWGLYLYDGDAWQPAAVVGEMSIDNYRVENVGTPRAIGGRFVADFQVDGYNHVYAEYVGGRWNVLLSPREAGIAGEPDPFLGGDFDINAQGSVLFPFFGNGGPTLGVHSNGETRIVARTLDLGPDGAAILDFQDLDLRDDGSLFFTAIDANDRAVLFAAARWTGPGLPGGPGAGPDTPAISAGGIVSATGTPVVSEVTPRSIFTIFGERFTDGREARSALLDGGRIATRLADTCVETGGLRTPLFAVFPGQINAQAPESLPPGPSDVVVIRGCATPFEERSAPIPVTVRDVAPAFFNFTNDASGVNPIAALHGGGPALAGPRELFGGAVETTPVARGGYVSLFATGLGDTLEYLLAGELPPGQSEVLGFAQVWIGGQELAPEDVLYVGVAPGLAGLYQIVVRVPENVGVGNQAVVVGVNGVRSPDGPYLAVE